MDLLKQGVMFKILLVILSAILQAKAGMSPFRFTQVYASVYTLWYYMCFVSTCLHVSGVSTQIVEYNEHCNFNCLKTFIFDKEIS